MEIHKVPVEILTISLETYNKDLFEILINLKIQTKTFERHFRNFKESVITDTAKSLTSSKFLDHVCNSLTRN